VSPGFVEHGGERERQLSFPLMTREPIELWLTTGFDVQALAAVCSTIVAAVVAVLVALAAGNDAPADPFVVPSPTPAPAPAFWR
jgi:hypothetical protein